MKALNAVLCGAALLACGRSASERDEVASPVTATAHAVVSAAYDAGLRAPACSSAGSGCDSGTLLVGRGTRGPEPSQPNTVNGSCADGSSGTFHSDESLDQLTVSTVDGSALAPGKTVRVDAKVWAYTSSGSDQLDLYYAASASAPSWTLIATLPATRSGSQVLSATYVLPAGAKQAVRGRFRYMGSAAACGTGGYDDHDDLVFAVAGSAPPADAFPVVSLTSPAYGASALSPVTLTASATDDVGVTKVEFREDGYALIGTVTAPPYSLVWNAADGQHAIEAWAYDTAGQVSFSSRVSFRAIVDRTPPTVSVIAPAAGATLYAPVTVTVSATDAVAVSRVELWEGTTLIGSAATSYTSFSWSPAPGSHTVVAKAYDTAGNVGTSAARSFTVQADVTPPAVSITAPADGARVVSITSIILSAADAAGVTRVEVYLDGALLGSRAAPASFSWNPATSAVGPHVLSARAYDAAGNVGVSAPITVTYLPDTVPPAVSLLTPEGAVLAGTVTLQAAATDDVKVSSVAFLADGYTFGVYGTSGQPWSGVWNTTGRENGPVVLAADATDAAGNKARSASVRAVVANTGAAYARHDATLAVPRCHEAAAVCDSGTLLDGLWLSEPHYPNSLSISPACQDAQNYYPHYSVASIDAIRVTSVDGGLFAPGKQVRVDVTAWAAYLTTIYLYAKDGAVREYGLGTGWVYLGAFPLAGSSNHTQVVSTTYTLGASPLQAVRAVSKWYSDGPALCGDGGQQNESDDLVFDTGLSDTTAPAAWMLLPADGAQLSGTVRVSAAAADAVGVTRVELYDGDVLLGSAEGAPYAWSWDTSSAAPGPHALTVRAYDAAGNAGTSAPVTVTVLDPAAP